MRLAEVETFVVGNPPPGFGGRYFVFVKLTTGCGIAGYGECYGATFGPRVVEHMIRDSFGRWFEGADPHHVERLMRRCHGSGFGHRPDLSMMGVFSGLEMACWDICGKAADLPVFEMLGGRVHDRLRAYTYIYPDAADAAPPPGRRPRVYTDPDVAAERALAYADRGFTALKFDPAGPYGVFDGRQPSLDALDRSEAFLKAIRGTVGRRVDLLFGTHGQFTVSGARRVARMLERYDPLWFEEPVPPDSPELMADVAAFTSVPVATGERLCTKHEFARVLDCKAAGILQMNLGRVGGLLEAKKIAGMAEARQVLIAPHLYCGPLVGAANVQLATCSPNFLILESIEDWGGFHARILKTPMGFEDGHVIPPTAPGLGVELDEEVARAHPYEGDRLHLEMAPDPL
jgi:L-alanine-DL-glutamate epimerase-like enolase superfamily enzyme